jgi:hypothetical protein
MKKPFGPNRLKASVLFVLTALVLLSAVRVIFFLHYRGPETPFAAFLPAFATGLRVDAKWLAIALLPSWALLLASRRFAGLWKAAAALAAIGWTATAALALINFGFYGFYGTPISTVVFGFFQDDTKAIVKTIWDGWPVGLYFLALAALSILPFAAAKAGAKEDEAPLPKKRFICAAVLGTVLLALIIRGSFGKFPLRHQDYSVSPDVFINATVPGGPASFYEALKGQRALALRGSPDCALKALGFRDAREAAAAIKAVSSPEEAPAAPAAGDHVVFALMEAMGRDFMEANVPGMNDTLGALAAELPHAAAFHNAVSVTGGTFPSLEGLIFDSPLTPLTQSRYGRQGFPFSKVLPFKKAGYRTVFLTSGPEAWRGIDANFPLQGFDKIIGAAHLKQRYPQAEVTTWGVGDEWMFRYARELIREADRRGEKLFLFMLSTSNHGPHRVPDGVRTKPVNAAALPAWIIDPDLPLTTAKLKTYQYAANALGRFVHGLRASPEGRRTLIAATGDHNVRIKYNPEGLWHHAAGVPILFWLPENLRGLQQQADVNRWASHRDIFPTLSALVLGQAPALHEGRNLFAKGGADLALSFSALGHKGFAIGGWGAAFIEERGKLSCYRWERRRLKAVDECSEKQLLMGRAAAAEEALAEYGIRRELTSN